MDAQEVAMLTSDPNSSAALLSVNPELSVLVGFTVL